MKRRSFFGIILAFFFGKRAVEEAPSVPITPVGVNDNCMGKCSPARRTATEARQAQGELCDFETEHQKLNAWIRENYANFAGTLVCEGDSIDGWINS